MTPDIKRMITVDAQGLTLCVCETRPEIVFDPPEKPYNDGYYFCKCENCSAVGDSSPKARLAVAAWNNRPYIPVIKELLKVIKQQHEAWESIKRGNSEGNPGGYQYTHETNKQMAIKAQLSTKPYINLIDEVENG